MGRPAADIRASLHSSGVYRIMYAEERRWHLTPETTRARALAWARRNKAAILDGAPTITLAPLMVGFFDAGADWIKRRRAKRQGISDKIRLDYAAHVKSYLIPLFGARDPRSLTAREIDDAISAVKGKGGRILASGTRYKLMHTMATIMQDLTERGIIPHNPLLGIKPYSKAPERPRDAIPAPALARLFPATHGALARVWGSPFWACAMLVMMDTGARPGELRALRWIDLDLDGRAVVIRAAMKSDGTRGTTKTDSAKAGRLSPRTAQELKILHAETRHAAKGDYVFTLDGEAPVSNAAVGQAFRRGLAAIGKGDEPWTPYWIRHSFITYALPVLSDDEIAMLAGHSGIAMQRRYRHPTDEIVLSRTKAAREKLDYDDGGT